MLGWAEYGKFTPALLVIVNPPGAVPWFASMTGQHTVEARRRIARVASSAVAVEIFAGGIATLLPGWK